MLRIAQLALRLARSSGAQHATVEAVRTREIDVRVREGMLEHVQEATTRRLSIGLYVDGRYSVARTSDIREDALAHFIPDAIAMTRALEEDPYRALPSPALYAGQTTHELEVEDPSYATLSIDARTDVARALDAATRCVEGADAILSVTSSVSDARTERWRVHSDGFVGTSTETTFAAGAEVSVQDPRGPRPEEYDASAARHWNDLVPAADSGRVAATRALNRRGATTGLTASHTVVIENRAAAHLVSYLLSPLMGSSLQQRRSYLDGRLGEVVASPLFTLRDDPHIARGLGSRIFDSEGIAARPLTLVERGTLTGFFIDTYYGRKLDVSPTTGSPSNLLVDPGTASFASLLERVGDGILITGFLGGNSNSTTGDFSLGIEGFFIRDGQQAAPIAGMNISGNHLSFWKSLVAVGSDLDTRTQLRVPSLVFDGVIVAGT